MEDKLQENQQQDLLNDLGTFDTSEYDARVRRARNWLFVVAAIQLVVGVIELSKTPEDLFALVAIIHGVIIAIYVALAVWSNKKAYEALITAMVIFLLLYIAGGLLDPVNFIRGILVKVFVVVALFNGIRAAKEAKALRSITHP